MARPATDGGGFRGEIDTSDVMGIPRIGMPIPKPILRHVANAACIGLMIVRSSGLSAQALTPDPGAWRPLSYADLQAGSSDSATYVDIWKDAIEANNRAYAAAGDKHFLPLNAPAIEAHFVIWSTQKSIVFSVLDTANGCTTRYSDKAVGATVKLCPVRIAQYQGAIVSTIGDGNACFLELDPTPKGGVVDRASSAAYAAYDVETKSIKTGMIVNHKAVDGCSMSFSLRPQ
jgi:hypothetical protein